jgi:hypothetical protein
MVELLIADQMVTGSIPVDALGNIVERSNVVTEVRPSVLVK